MISTIRKRNIRPIEMIIGILGISKAGGAYNSQEGKENQYLLMEDMHHIISDEISHQTMIREFQALAGGETLAAQRIQYKDYACWWEP